jgi:arginine decarboxylase
MFIMDHSKTPLVDGLRSYQQRRVVSLDVPGHKQGKSNVELIDIFGQKAMAMDYNASKALDNLAHPTSIIKEAQQLAADLFHAKHAFFIVNGTSLAVMAMILSVAKANDKIIMPRNVHKSVINALVITGAIPVYVNPGIDDELGISLAMDVKDIEQAIKQHPDAKAILVNNPTYYGVVSDLRGIVKLAKSANMKVIVDEAHGAHFTFSDRLPLSAMQAGASMSSVSMHKTGGSLTQSSILLANDDMDSNHVLQMINLLQTTSPSYLLMASLDVARKQLAMDGKARFEKILDMVDYARKEINNMDGYIAFSKERANQKGWYDFDTSKLSIHTHAANFSGLYVYEQLRDEYGIQIEFGDVSNILAIVSTGDRLLDIERFIAALSDIKANSNAHSTPKMKVEYIEPIVRFTPQQAFYMPSQPVLMSNSLNRVAAESIMAYPPGIPIVAFGEVITQAVLDSIQYIKENHGFLMGSNDPALKTIQVVKEK